MWSASGGIPSTGACPVELPLVRIELDLAPDHVIHGCSPTHYVTFDLEFLCTWATTNRGWMEYVPPYHERVGMLVYRRGKEDAARRSVSYCYLSRNNIRLEGGGGACVIISGFCLLRSDVDLIKGCYTSHRWQGEEGRGEVRNKEEVSDHTQTLQSPLVPSLLFPPSSPPLSPSLSSSLLPLLIFLQPDGVKCDRNSVERGGDKEKEKGVGGRGGGCEGGEGGGEQVTGEDGYINDTGQCEGEEEEEEEEGVRDDSSDGEVMGKVAVRKYEQFNIECGDLLDPGGLPSLPSSSSSSSSSHRVSSPSLLCSPVV